MSNTRIIKRRVKATQNISQITKAMQMVAASKMKQAQNKALSGKTYTEKLQNILASFLTSSTKFDHYLLKTNKSSSIVVLFVTTNKGLCGSLNTNHFRKMQIWFDKQNINNLQFVTVGKKGREFIMKLGGNIVADFSDLPDKFGFNDTLPISHFLIQLFKEKSAGSSFMSYSNFVSTLSQKPKLIQLLPISLEAIYESLGLLESLTREKQKPFQNKEYIIEPNQEIMTNWLLPYFIELEVYHFLLESFASEHSARMVAMKNATENANELISELKLEYNKARQQIITSEITDIVTAWKSLQ